MTTKDSKASKNYRAKLREQGGASMGLAMQPGVLAIVNTAAKAWMRSRNWTVNELVRIAAMVSMGLLPDESRQAEELKQLSTAIRDGVTEFPWDAMAEPKVSAAGEAP